jgi:hypothetical protein
MDPELEISDPDPELKLDFNRRKYLQFDHYDIKKPEHSLPCD